MIEKKVSLPDNLAKNLEKLSSKLGVSQSEILRNSIIREGTLDLEGNR